MTPTGTNSPAEGAAQGKQRLSRCSALPSPSQTPGASCALGVNRASQTLMSA